MVMLNWSGLFLSKAFLLLQLCLVSIQAYSRGPPAGVCTSLVPGHSSSTGGPNPGGFFIYSDLIDDGGDYNATQVYTIRLEGSQQFKGFMIQARESGTTDLIGSFSGLPSWAHLLTCGSPSSSTVVHSNANLKDSVTVTWTAPSAPGTLEIRYTVVVRNDGTSIYYANMNANDHRPPDNTDSCPMTDKSPSSTFPIVLRSPSNCERSSCTFYWAMGPNTANSQYLDVYMEGTVDGWLAVGFSLDRTMGKDDVLGCKVENNAVVVLDTWNPSGYYAPNQADSNSSGICAHSTDHTNGRLSCLFSRSAGITNLGQDYNLDSSYYIIKGYRTNSQAVSSNLDRHSAIPPVTPNQYNPMRDMYVEAPPPPPPATNGSACPRGPSSSAVYPFRVGSPGDDYYFAARFNDENDSFIDMQLEGNANGWIAVGFTETRSMFNSDVLACKRDSSSDTVAVIDTWNPSSYSNVLDASQSGICQHTTQYNNGRISCTFSKYIGVIDNGQDLDLNDTLYRIYNAYSSSRGPATTGLMKHSITPSFSSAQSNLLTDIREGNTESVDTWPKQELLKTHGTFMTIAWLALAMSGAFFAAWMKPVFPNGEWFLAHRILMVGSLIVGILGFIFPFIAHAKSLTPGLISFHQNGKNTAHFVIGIIIMCLHIANPLIALLRCEPKHEKRWIFNLTHAHIIGYLSLILSLINIALGAHLLDNGNYEVAGFYIVFIILLMLFQVFLFTIHTINAYKAPEDDRPALVHSLLKYKYICASSKNDEKKDIPMTGSKESQKEEEEKKAPPEKKKPLESALVRTSWITVIAHLIAVGVAVVIMIILIAIA